MKQRIELDATMNTRHLEALAQYGADTTPLMKRWGTRVKREAQRSARAKAPDSDFWNELAQSVDLRAVTPRSVEVFASHPAAAQKEFGGEIRPRNKKALTIPIGSEAYGKSVGDFAHKELFVIDSDNPETTGILGYSEGEEFHPLFVLRTVVRQKPDPWWPSEETIAAVGTEEAAVWIEKQEERALSR